MELLNIEIDQELPQEAIYHVLLLQTSITIWPVVIPSSFSCFVCLLNCSLDMESMGGAHSTGMERFSGVCQLSGVC